MEMLSNAPFNYAQIEGRRVSNPKLDPYFPAE
jgi:hypothetical protein